MRKTAVMLCAVLLLPVALCAEEYLRGYPFVVIEEGPSDYLIMYNSLIDDQITLYGEGENRQGDTCIDKSSFALKPDAIPADAEVVKAYLVWMGAVDSGKLDQPTDNAVHLKFIHKDGYIYEKDIVAGEGPKLLGDTSDPALFESAKFTAETAIGCTETEPGTATTAELAYFTYRVEVTDFFQEVKDFIAVQGTPLTGSAALPGDYTMSGLDCVEDDVYRCPTLMLSNWVIVLVYRSAEKTDKSIYLYNLFALNQDRTEISLYGISIPSLPKIRMTLIVGEGDPKTGNEQAYAHGWHYAKYWEMVDSCEEEGSLEIWDSRASIISYETEKGFCVQKSDTFTFGLDVDDWYMGTAPDALLNEFDMNGLSSFVDFVFDFYSEELVTNLIALSIDRGAPSFDIPYEDEMRICSCRAQSDPQNAYCADRPHYYLIKVQNWGAETAKAVLVSDDLLNNTLTYIPGSTEMATIFDENGDGLDWRNIPDGPDGVFPLLGRGYTVADTMEPCAVGKKPCAATTRLIRFKARPAADLAAGRTVGSSAKIGEEAAANRYMTNKGIPVVSSLGQCEPVSACPEPPKSLCGGGVEGAINDDDILTDDDTKKPKDDGCGCSVVF